MTRAGATLDAIPARVPWTALRSFVGHLGPDSALVRELEPDRSRWMGTERVQAMLADLIDAVRALDWHYVSAHKKGNVRRPDPYPRPTDGAKGQTIGREPIPAKDFDEWWNGGGADG